VIRHYSLALAALWLGLSPSTVSAADPAPVSFLNDVVPILTRLGCNQGACHGKGAGQNGFRLSLRGYAPELDHFTLTREFLGRRCDPTSPEASLILRKASGQVNHEGGKLFDTTSPAYVLLRDWIAQGMAGPKKDDRRPEALRVSTASTLLKPGQTGQLAVEVTYSDKSTRDVTWLAKFESNDAGVVRVDERGQFEVLRNGETSLRVAFGTLVSVIVLTAPFDTPVDPATFKVRNNFIDEHVFNKLAALRITPSELCSDESFLRRAYLDTLGVLPTPAEVRAFLADPRPDRRAKLIDALLERPEFVDHWALFLSDLLQNRKERDHDVRGTKGVRAFHAWLREQVKQNRPWDELARDVLTVKGTTAEHPAVGYFVVTVGEQGEAHRSEVVASVAQAFLGTRIGCAQCHNHPLERYTQDDYYHFAAFFSRMHLDRKDPKEGVTTLKVGPRDSNTKGPVGVNQPRTNQFLAPQPLDRSVVTIDPAGDPREVLAKWMTDPKNDAFAGAMVNRIWRHYLGVGLVEPVDDLRASNPPTNPELWKALVADFVGHKYDLKHLMRTILNSRTYQLASATKPGNEADARFYSHYYARRLPAEVLLDALASATAVPDEFPGYPAGMRAGQLPDPTLKSYFLTTFGRSERVTACACERTGEVTLPQLLHLMNGQTVVDRIRNGDGRLAKLLRDKPAAAKVVEELFLASLSRRPTAAELEKVTKALATAENPEEGYRDLFWALLNAKEFSFNH
jgi:hypothetical protein